MNKQLLDNFLNKEERAIEKAVFVTKQIINDIKQYDIIKNKNQKNLLGKNCKDLFFSIVREMHDVVLELPENKRADFWNFLDNKLMPIFSIVEETLSEKNLIEAEDYINKDGNTETWLPGYERYWEECDDEE